MKISREGSKRRGREAKRTEIRGKRSKTVFFLQPAKTEINRATRAKWSGVKRINPREKYTIVTTSQHIEKVRIQFRNWFQ